MNYKVNDFISELSGLDNTCSIGVNYNRPPTATFKEFKTVFDAIFAKRVTQLQVNLCFLKVECKDYLIEKLKQNNTL